MSYFGKNFICTKNGCGVHKGEVGLVVFDHVNGVTISLNKYLINLTKDEFNLHFSPVEIITSFVEGNNAFDIQIGGDHYTKLKIQPIKYSMENGLDAMQHTVIKYVTRFRDKGGVEDLKKAKHVIDMLIEFEEGKK